jgi:hypothetical protein
MTLPTGRMADSVHPMLIPEQFHMRPNGVLAYLDGEYAWTDQECSDFARLWRISVTGNPAHALGAREIDVERFDANPDDVPAYRDARSEHGLSTHVYCSRSTVPAVLDAIGTEDHIRWHIATLDNNTWNPVSIANSIHSETGRLITPDLVVAIQCYSYSNYDVSLLYGPPDWEKG